MAFTVFGHHADASGQSFGRTGDAEDLTLEVNRPCRGRLQAVNGAGNFGATRAHEAGQGDDFAATEGEADVAIGGLTGQAGDFEQGFIRRSVTDREDVGQFTTDHHRDQLSRRHFRGHFGGDQTSVAEDRDPVGQAEDLVHLVGRVDDGHAAGLEPGDRPEEGGHLLVGQRGRRFIHQHQIGFASEGFGDLDDLGLRHRQTPHREFRVKVDLQLLKQLFRPEPLGGTIDAPEGADGFTSERDVLRDRQVGDGHQFLMDHRDPGFQRGVRGGEFDACTAPFHVPSVRSIQAGQHLHQGRLSSAVLAHQGVHLARPEFDRRRMQHGQSAEVLAQ